MAKITVLGSGGFGIALSVMLSKYGHTVSLWSAFEEEAEELARTREHKKLLSGIVLPPSVLVTSDDSVVGSAELLLFAVPSSAVREVAARIKRNVVPAAVVASVAKGFEPSTQKRLSQVLKEELPHNEIVILSGPSHAEEVAVGVPTTLVAASESRAAAEYVQDEMMNEVFRIYVNDDVAGVELGGALKNVIALAAGICDGLKLGDNTKAALMTRGITEIARLGVALGAKAETFAGLSGIGDLIVTCTSMHSRNRRAGILIGEGMPAAEAVKAIGMTVEGYKATVNAYELARRTGVEMPITEQMYKVLFENYPVTGAVADLMGRPKKHETESVWVKPQ